MFWKRKQHEILYLSDLDEETREEVALFVGRKYDIYQKKWNKFSLGKKGLKFSWNWAAFLFSLFWFAYRKMYGFAYMLFGLTIIGNVTVLLLTNQNQTSTSSSTAGSFLVAALLGNFFYQKYVIKKVKQLQILYPNRKERLEIIKQKGGTSWKAVILLALLVILNAVAIYIIDSKLYYSRVTPKFNEALKYQENGEIDKAVSLYKEIKNEDYAIVGTYANLAIIYLSQGDIAAAKKELKELVKYFPDDTTGKKIKKDIENAESVLELFHLYLDSINEGDIDKFVSIFPLGTVSQESRRQMNELFTNNQIETEIISLNFNRIEDYKVEIIATIHETQKTSKEKKEFTNESLFTFVKINHKWFIEKDVE